MSEVADFLDELTYGRDSTPGLKERRDEWRAIAKEKFYGPGRTGRSGTSSNPLGGRPTASD
jgi:hypothetical protein